MRKLQDEDLVRVKMADLRRLQTMEHDYNRMKLENGRLTAIADKMAGLLAELNQGRKENGERKADQPK